MFHKILIANRGEIACRIIKTAKRLHIKTVAIYSHADKDSLHVRLADEAYCVGAPPAIESYLNIEKIIDIAIKSNCHAIHPGYGFLSENAHFARACEKAAIIFIGPNIKALEIMGSKQLSKQQLETTDVPLTPGYHGSDQSDDTLLREARRLGFPILLKASNGGGGKGMRAVYNETEFHEALAGARREAKASFADDTMLIEKLICNPRHIEMQIMADNHGQIVHLFERDCSIQRRHQKIIEEAPAAHLTPSLREQLAAAAIQVARAIEYQGAGTIEFLVDGDKFYFMEMNTRLQVEHPVTEMITGLDLVEWQLKIASNEPLPLGQKDIHAKGHAIECRIYAEDTEHDFMPSIGHLTHLVEPKNPHIRIDTGVTKHSEITVYYDPMIAKLIAWGDNRNEAQARLQEALSHYYIGGVKTNIAFLSAILNHPNFINAHYSTSFLDEPIKITSPNKESGVIMAAALDYLNLRANLDPLYEDTFAWQLHGHSHWSTCYVVEGTVFDVLVTPLSFNQVTLQLGTNESISLRLTNYQNKLQLDNGLSIESVMYEACDGNKTFYTAQGPIVVSQFYWQEDKVTHDNNHQLTAPMPGIVVALFKKKGEHILTGEALMVLEAMKMEHTIRAPRDGVIQDIFYDIGAQVTEGATLAALDAPTSS